MPSHPVHVYFITNDAHAMFPGATTVILPESAGVSEYTLANELSRRPNYRVHWVFSLSQGIGLIHHPRIDIRDVSAQSAPGLLTRITRRIQRLLGVRVTDRMFRDRGTKVVVASPGAVGSEMWAKAVAAGASQLVRVLSEQEMFPPRGETASSTAPFNLMESWGIIERSRAHVVLQSEQQLDLLRSLSAVPATVVREGWPPQFATVSPADRKVILWVASSRPLNRPWRFLELARTYPNEQFTMVMPTFSDAENELFQVIKRQASTIPNLTFFGDSRSLADVDDLFASSRVYVNTSELLGLPSTLLRAGAAGAALLTNGLDPDGLIVREQLGIVGDGSFESLVSGLGELLQRDAALALEYGQRNRDYMGRERSLDRYRDNVVAVIEELVQR